MRCGRCCTRFGVCITPFDIMRISAATGMKPEEFVSTLPEPGGREREEPAVLIGGAPSLIVLRRGEGEVCCFYSGEGCAIYENRPMLCRSYPFVSRAGKLCGIKSRACPASWEPEGAERKRYDSDCAAYSDEVRRYRQIADEWNQGVGGGIPAFLEFISRRL